MKLTFELGNFFTKVNLSLLILCVFFVLYLTIPDSEFENVKSNNSYLDRFYFTVSCHTGRRELDTYKPLSDRAKFLTIFHMLLSFTIIFI